MRTFFACVFIFVAIAESIAIVTAGFEDQEAFVFWTLIAASIAGLLATKLKNTNKSLRKLIVYLLSAFFGFIYGLVFSYGVAFFLGPWIGAFGMPILLCWTAAGLSTFVAARLINDFPLKKSTPLILLTAVLASISVFSIPAIVRRVNNEQEVKIFVFRYTPGKREIVIVEDDPLSYSHDQRLSLTEHEVLKNRYQTGRLNLESQSVYGKGPESKVILVLSEPLTNEVSLRQPNQSTVFYFQNGNDFEAHSNTSPLLERRIVLGPREYTWENTDFVALSCMVESWDGSSTGRDVMLWEKGAK